MCRLYDEQLVRNIMVATGLSIYEFVKSNRKVTPQDICDFIDAEASGIIDDTISDMNAVEGMDSDQEEYPDEDGWDGPGQEPA
jgi:hypothetical protein